MKEKELFIKALGTLFWSWGSEAPAEAVWAGNDLLEWFEKEHGVQLGARFDEEDPDGYEAVIEAIKNS